MPPDPNILTCRASACRGSGSSCCAARPPRPRSGREPAINSCSFQARHRLVSSTISVKLQHPREASTDGREHGAGSFPARYRGIVGSMPHSVSLNDHCILRRAHTRLKSYFKNHLRDRRESSTGQPAVVGQCELRISSRIAGEGGRSNSTPGRNCGSLRHWRSPAGVLALDASLNIEDWQSQPAEYLGSRTRPPTRQANESAMNSELPGRRHDVLCRAWLLLLSRRPRRIVSDFGGCRRRRRARTRYSITSTSLFRWRAALVLTRLRLGVIVDPNSRPQRGWSRA